MGAATALPASAAASAGPPPAFSVIGGTNAPDEPGAFVPIAPFRALDTRTTAAVAADSSVTLHLGGVGGIPKNVGAVVFNLTVADAKSFGFITAYPADTTRPNASHVNFSAGQIVPNSVTVPVNLGRVTLFNRSSGSVQLIADVSGYYLVGEPTAPGAFKAISPSRLLDTRNSSAVGPDSSVSFQVGGASGIPANAASVVFNLTVADAKSFGFITAHASGTSRPNASNVNFSAGQIVPNAVTVPVGADGKVTLFNRSSGTVQLIADVSGYYLPGVAASGGTFQGLSPARLLDTRNSAAVGSDSSVSFQVGGVSGIPAKASAVVFNLTVADAKSFGFITAHASGTGRPNASNVNFSAGQIVPNSVTVPVGTDGRVTLFNRSGGTTHLIADVSGYYLPGTPSRSVYTWGANWDGQLGNGSSAEHSTTAVQATGVSRVQRVEGLMTKIALGSDGTVRTWGSGMFGQLGNRTTADSHVPVQVEGLSTVVAVEGAETTNYAVLSHGTVWAWGLNSHGQLGDGTTTNSTIPVQVAGLTGVTEVTSDGGSAYALMEDGTVRGWGDNRFGQLGNGTTTNSSVPVEIPGLTGVKSIEIESGTAYALLQDGSVRAWGGNRWGQLGNGTTADSSVPVPVIGLGNVKAVHSGYHSASALLNDGTVRAWGYNAYGQLGNGTTSNSSVPVQVSGLTGVAALSSEFYSYYALLTDGTVRSWGYNASGELGNGTTSHSSIPVQAIGLAGVKEVGSNWGNGYALLTDGTVRAWGGNYAGELGNGTTTASSVPVVVQGLSDVTALQS